MQTLNRRIHFQINIKSSTCGNKDFCTVLVLIEREGLQGEPS